MSSIYEEESYWWFSPEGNVFFHPREEDWQVDEYEKKEKHKDEFKV